MSKEEALDRALVEEFVTKAHADLNRVMALLDQEPRLVNASWDWAPPRTWGAKTLPRRF